MLPDLLAFLSWYVALTLLGAAALPLAFKFFRFLPDRGYTFARPLGLLVVCYLFWLLGTLGILPNAAVSLWVVAVGVGGAGLWWLGRAGWQELRGWLREHWRVVVCVELTFLLAFAAWAVVRAYNPNIDHTEKPMDFMFINSILRSPSFPPQDAWLSGRVISYYYFGYLITAALTRATGVAAGQAFNLMLALLFALTTVGTLGIGMNLVALVKPHLPAALNKRDRPTAAALLLESFGPGLLGPLLVVLAGNFYGPLALAHANSAFNFNLPTLYYDFGDATTPPGARLGSPNVWEWLDVKQTNTPPAPRAAGDTALKWEVDWWAYWFYSARTIHDRNLVGAEIEAIDETPIFSFLHADLHPHVMGLPFVVLAVAVALQWLLEGQQAFKPRPAVTWRDFKQWAADFKPELIRLGLTGLVLGSLSFLNTWDFPMYVFLTVVAFAGGLGLQLGWRAVWQKWFYPAFFAVGAGAIGGLLYLPYYLTAQSQVEGILPNLVYPTRFQQTLVMFGPVWVCVTLFAVWLAVATRRILNWRLAVAAGGGIVGVLVLLVAGLSLGAWLNKDLYDAVLQLVQPLTEGQALSLLLQRRLVDSWATLWPAALIAIAVGVGVALLGNPRGVAPQPDPDLEDEETAAPPAFAREAEVAPWRSPALLMAVLMMLTGALLALGPEWVYVRDLFGDRMNTLFKFYFQAWVLLGLAGAWGVWYLWQWAKLPMRVVACVLVGLAVVGGLLYTVPATQSKVMFNDWVWTALGAAAVALAVGLGVDGFIRAAGRRLPVGGLILFCAGAAGISLFFSRPGDSGWTLSRQYDADWPECTRATLDGLRFMECVAPQDAQAIQWLQQTVTGTPVIAEGIFGSYWTNGRYSRISMATGLPTVLGWPWHEIQWRGRRETAQINERELDVCGLYRTQNWEVASFILDKYQIEYVYLSPLEISRYGGGGLNKFAANLQPVFEVGEGNDRVVIYQRLAAAPKSALSADAVEATVKTACDNLEQ